MTKGYRCETGMTLNGESLEITASIPLRMVYWLSHTATLYGVFMFILPLLLLPLLASSYAEVNYEGGKILQVYFRLISGEESSKPCSCSKPDTECQVWAQIL